MESIIILYFLRSKWKYSEYVNVTREVFEVTLNIMKHLLPAYPVNSFSVLL